MLIMVNQVKNLVGFRFEPGEKAVTFVDVCVLTFHKLSAMPWEMQGLGIYLVGGRPGNLSIIE